MDSFDENDPLWNTLGKARPIKVSTGFARRVRRAATQEESAEKFGFAQLLRWLFPIGAAAAVIAVWLSFAQSSPTQYTALTEVTFTGAADLPSLVTYDDGSMWSEIVFY